MRTAAAGEDGRAFGDTRRNGALSSASARKLRRDKSGGPTLKPLFQAAPPPARALAGSFEVETLLGFAYGAGKSGADTGRTVYGTK